MKTTNHRLSNDEKQCLQFWFRHAISKLEQQDVILRLLEDNSQDEPKSAHHLRMVRRPLRSKRTSPAKQLVF